MDATGKWTKRGVWLTFAAVMTIGCNPITLTSFLLRSDEKLPAQYALRPKEGPKHDKDAEIKILIMAGMAPGGMTAEFVGSERELASAIAKKLPEVGKANKEVYTVVPPHQFDTFKMQNPNWRTMKAATIGKRLGADYVFELTLSGLQMYQQGALNQIYEGKAQLAVAVTDTTEERGEPKYRYEFTVAHPGFPRPADSMSPSQFKMEFVEKLAQEVVFRHIDHKAAEGIASR
jgi:hypothetical protein